MTSKNYKNSLYLLKTSINNKFFLPKSMKTVKKRGVFSKLNVHHFEHLFFRLLPKKECESRGFDVTAHLQFSQKCDQIFCIESSIYVSIMAEFEPYSFEPMRDSSGSEEDNDESQDERRRGNTSWCECEFCAIWQGQQERECLCCQEIEEAVNKISGE